MTDSILEYDPRTKKYIRDLLYSRIYGPLMAHFNSQIKSIITRNCAAMVYSHRSFYYKGKLYEDDLHPLPRKMNTLAVQLRPEMKTYLSELNEINTREIPYVWSFLNQVLNSSDSVCDYKALLPSALHPAIEEWDERCPYKRQTITPEIAIEFKQKNAEHITMLKQRMVSNLLI